MLKTVWIVQKEYESGSSLTRTLGEMQIKNSMSPTSGYISKRLDGSVLKSYLHTHVYSSTIHSSQEVEAAPVFINGWMDKQMLSIPTMGYYSAVKRKEVLTCATAWMNLESIMLSEICQSQKGKCCRIPLIRGP